MHQGRLSSSRCNRHVQQNTVLRPIVSYSSWNDSLYKEANIAISPWELNIAIIANCFPVFIDDD